MGCLLFLFGCEDITHFQNYLIFLSWKYHPCETRLSIIQVKCSSNWPVSSPSLSIFSPNLVKTALFGMQFTIFQSHLTLTIMPINCAWKMNWGEKVPKGLRVFQIWKMQSFLTWDKENVSNNVIFWWWCHECQRN